MWRRKRPLGFLADGRVYWEHLRLCISAFFPELLPVMDVFFSGGEGGSEDDERVMMMIGESMTRTRLCFCMLSMIRSRACEG